MTLLGKFYQAFKEKKKEFNKLSQRINKYETLILQD